MKRVLRYLALALVAASLAAWRGEAGPSAVGPAQITEFDSLVRVLNTGDRYERDEAMFALGGFKTDTAAEAIVSMLRRTGWSEPYGGVTTAADILARMGQVAVDPLVRVLSDSSPSVREQAVSALMRIGDGRAIDPLVGLLGDPDRRVRENAVLSLSQFGARPRNPLVAAMRDHDSLVREGAARALADLPDSTLAPVMIPALKDPDSRVRAYAAYALRWSKDGHVTEPLIAALRDPEPDVRGKAAVALGTIKDHRALKPLIETLDDTLIWDHSFPFYFFGQSTGEPLVAALKDPRPRGRHGAADALGTLAYKPAIKPLAAMLRNPDSTDRISAVRALGQMKDAAAIPALGAAVGDSVHGVRMAAISSLYTLAYWVPLDSSLAPILLATLGGKDEEVRISAIGLIPQLKYPPANDVLVQVMEKDSNSLVRVSAACALGAAGDSRAIPALIGFLADTEVTNRGALMIQAEPPSAHLSAVRTLAAMGAPAVTPLVAALSDPNPVVRFGAARALGEMAGRREGAKGLTTAIDPLIRCLDDMSWTVRNWAIGALRSIGDPRAIRPLIMALHDNTSRSREVIADALRGFGDTAIAVLIKALRDGAPSVRWAAASLLVSREGDWPELRVVARPEAMQPLARALKERDLAVIAGAHLYFLSQGEPGTEDVLIQALRKYGTHKMDQAFWWSGHAPLQRAADERGGRWYHDGKDEGWGPRWGSGREPR